MSRETLEYHWGKHHRGYVENLNRQITGTELDGMTLEDIINVSYNKGDLLPAFNNAAQVCPSQRCSFQVQLCRVTKLDGARGRTILNSELVVSGN